MAARSKASRVHRAEAVREAGVKVKVESDSNDRVFLEAVGFSGSDVADNGSKLETNAEEL